MLSLCKWESVSSSRQMQPGTKVAVWKAQHRLNFSPFWLPCQRLSVQDTNYMTSQQPCLGYFQGTQPVLDHLSLPIEDRVYHSFSDLQPHSQARQLGCVLWDILLQLWNSLKPSIWETGMTSSELLWIGKSLTAERISSILVAKTMKIVSGTQKALSECTFVELNNR